MRSEYINANKWHTRACTQFIHTLDTKNDVLHTMNVHCVQTYEEFSIYAINGKCHIHSPVTVVSVLLIQLKVIVLVDVLVHFGRFIEINRWLFRIQTVYCLFSSDRLDIK